MRYSNRRGVASGLAALAMAAISASALLTQPLSANAATASGAGHDLTRQEIHKLLNPGPRVHSFLNDAWRKKVGASSAGSAAAASNLVYHGGQVMSSANNSVPIFWEPPTLQSGAAAVVAANYNTLVQRYFQDVGGNGLNQVNAQYYEVISGTQHFIMNSSHMVSAIVDTSPYPIAGSGCAGNGANCIDDAQVQAEVTKVITANALPVNKSTMYFVFTASGEASCFGPTQCFKPAGSTGSNFVFCAYHSFYPLSGQNVIYANMPYGASAFQNGCTSLSSFPNGSAADIVLSTTSHEHMEATTDPYLDAWFDVNGEENGDKCAYNYGALNFDGGLANELWNGNFYALQQEWSNATTACSQGAPVSGQPTVSVGDVSIAEGNSGTTTLSVPLTLSATSASNVSVTFTTANATATAPSDYVAKTNTRTFAPGQTTLALLITINGDTVVEPNETFNINLSNPVGATIAKGVGVETITNDDAVAGPTFSIGDVSILEGNSGTKQLIFTITLSAAQAGTTTVQYATADGTASAGSDYVAKSGAATFTPGLLTRHVAVTINGDTTIEGNETVFVNLSAPVGATLAKAQGIGTITNDD